MFSLNYTCSSRNVFWLNVVDNRYSELVLTTMNNICIANVDSQQFCEVGLDNAFDIFALATRDIIDIFYYRYDTMLILIASYSSYEEEECREHHPSVKDI
jgi:hypothetical protein